MRHLRLLLGLAACSTWTHYETSDEGWPVVVAALRAPEGRAVLVAADRGYYVREEALRDEIGAFTAALADAAETQGPPRVAAAPRGGVQSTVMVSTASDEVIAFPTPTRRFALDRLAVKASRLDSDGMRYVVTLEQRPNHYLTVSARGTPAVERAWQQLAKRARAEAGPVAPGYSTIHDADGFAREIGIDLRGIDPVR